MQIFKFQRCSSKLSFLFPSHGQSASESLLAGYVLDDREATKTHLVQQHVQAKIYWQRTPSPWGPWSLTDASKHWAEAKTFLYAELDLTISFPSAIFLAHDSSFKKDQDILVLPLDLQKFDTHEKLARDVLKHFGKVKRNQYIEGWIQQQLVWVDNISPTIGITAFNWVVPSLASRPCCLIITVSLNIQHQTSKQNKLTSICKIHNKSLLLVT